MGHPIVVAQFTVSSPWTAWANLSAGLWYINFNGVYPLIDAELSEGLPTKAIEAAVGSVVYRGEDLLKAESLTELASAPSFYWNSQTLDLVVHFPAFNPPNETTSVGIIYSVSHELYDSLEGFVFFPHMKDLPPTAQEKDRLFFKKIAISSWTMTLDNAGHDYDGMPEWGVYNKVVKYYIGRSDLAFSSFAPLKQGRIRDFSFENNEVVINIQDLRAQLATRVPTAYFSEEEYEDLAQKIIGKKKPLAFGRLLDAEPICVNAESIAGPYEFLLADGDIAAIKSVDQVRVANAPITPLAIDLQKGTITLSSAHIKDGASFKDLRVDFQGYVDETGTLIENPLNIISFLLSRFSNVPYTEEFYEMDEWSKEIQDKPSVALYIASPSELLSIIERIMEATRGGFLIASDGRYTWRTPNYASRPKWNIQDTDWLYEPSVAFDTSEVLASVRVGYGKSQKEDEYRYVENLTKQKEVLRNFNLLDDEDFELILSDKEAAEKFAEDVMQLSHEPAILVSGRLPITYAGMQIGRNAQIQVNRLVRGEFVHWLGEMRGEILKVSPDALKGEVEVTVRVVPGIPEYVEAKLASAVYGYGVYGVISYGEA